AQQSTIRRYSSHQPSNRARLVIRCLLLVRIRQGGRMTRIRIWLAASFLWLALAAPGLAQTQITTGTIEGTVVDASSAVPPGRYTVTFSLSGFATLVQQDVVVSVGESVRLSPSMKVSGVAETVTVTTESATVEATRTAAASTLDQKT